jgi:hypothetical protein
VAWKPGRSPVGKGVLTTPVPTRAPSPDAIAIPSLGTSTALIRARDIAVGGISLNSQVSNTLASWVPQLQFGGANAGMTFSTQFGIFFTIGNLVIVNFQLALTALGTSTGNASISGLPIVALNVGLGGIAQSVVPIAYANMAVTAALFSAAAIDGSASLNLVLLNNGTANATSMTNAHFTNTSGIGGTVTYIGQT